MQLTANQQSYIQPGTESQIEGYWAMVCDNGKHRWCLHHRKEINNLTGELTSKSELISRGEYYHVPPNELIWMTLTSHMKMHKSLENKGRHNKRGKIQKESWCDRVQRIMSQYDAGEKISDVDLNWKRFHKDLFPERYLISRHRKQSFNSL